jgi:hypothetical protein
MPEDEVFPIASGKAARLEKRLEPQILVDVLNSYGV